MMTKRKRRNLTIAERHQILAERADLERDRKRLAMAAKKAAKARRAPWLRLAELHKQRRSHRREVARIDFEIANLEAKIEAARFFARLKGINIP